MGISIYPPFFYVLSESSKFRRNPLAQVTLRYPPEGVVPLVMFLCFITFTDAKHRPLGSNLPNKYPHKSLLYMMSVCQPSHACLISAECHSFFYTRTHAGRRYDLKLAESYVFLFTHVFRQRSREMHGQGALNRDHRCIRQ